jgi:hypothetical protein
MKIVKQVLRPERLRQVPRQFSWVDQDLVQRHFIDRLDARACALYLFWLTVADAQGLSYYGSSTLARRLHCNDEELAAARGQLVDQDLIAWRDPLVQVLALPGAVPREMPREGRRETPPARHAAAPVSLAQLLQQMEARRGGL